MISDFYNSAKAAILLGTILVIGLFYNLGGVPLFDEDEGAYAEVTREMLDRGDFVVPHLEGTPFFHKPPMIYWTQAVCVHLLGLNEFSLRLPSALASLLWATILYLFLRRHTDAQSAWLAPFFLITALQTGIIAKAAIADALLNLFIAATMLALFEYISSGRKIFLWSSFGAMALGFLTKGPIAVVIPAVTGTLYFLTEKQFKRWLRMAIDPIGWLIFLVIVLPWYISLYYEFGGLFVREMFLTQNVGRFRSAMEGHSGPFFYYIPVIILGMLPYTTLLFLALRDVKRHWRDSLGRFLILWFACVFILFSIADTKLHHYVVYGYVPLFIFMSKVILKEKRVGILLAPAAIFLFLLELLPLIADSVVPYISDVFAKTVVAGAITEFTASYYIIVGLSLSVVIATSILPKITPQTKLLITGLVFAILINGYIVPKAGAITQTPVKSAALLARQKGYEVVMWQMNYPSFIVYYPENRIKRTLFGSHPQVL